MGKESRELNATPAGASRRARVAAGLIGAGCLGLLVLASWLTAASEGHGTHTQLGLRACGWASVLDRPCPTCGMTTAFAHAAEGNLLASAHVQPFGFLLAVLTAAVFWGSAHVAATGSALHRAAGRLLSTRVLWAGAGLLVAAWVYKMATWS
jgi:hypothetical protein